MGEDADESRGTAVVEGRVDTLGDTATDEAGTGGVDPADAPKVTDAARRRFAKATIAGIVVAAVPFLWNLWSPWESPNFLRHAIYEDNFYDLQARAIFHGHLWLANGSIGIEGFIHAGREYTYFGLFPSLLRMPILLVTSRLDSLLTAPFMLLAWLAAALFTALLLWRVRVLVRGDSALGRAEAASYGVLMTTIMGGSVYLILAATPYVFNEDLFWSICLTVGSIFALLGVLERPSWGRVVASGVLVLFANLDRVTTGWACVGAAVLIAVWFRLGRGGEENRRWFVPILIAGIVPLIVGCAVNFAKFGVPFGLPVVDQVWTSVNAYRRQFLAANHHSEVGTAFIPSDALAYLQPFGIRLTPVFPFVTLPAAPSRAVSGVLFDRRYRTASMPASMPLLFLLSGWGLVAAFRPRPPGKVALTRILLLAAGGAGAALLLWGYIAPRYLADFMPFLILGSAVAMADIWRRLEGRNKRVRIGVFAVITVVAVFTIVANIGMAIVPNDEWNTGQVLHYVEAQKAISDLTGHPLNARVERGTQLPEWRPAGQLFVVGDCDGLYISNGENYSTVPSQQYIATTWMAVERGHAFQHTFHVTLNEPESLTAPIPLVSAGANSVTVRVEPADGRRLVRVVFTFTAPDRTVYGTTPYVGPGGQHQVVVITDPAKHQLLLYMDGTAHISTTLDTNEPIHVDTQHATTGGTPPVVSVTNVTASTPQPTLCQSLDH
jgi:hypothetical protein